MDGIAKRRLKEMGHGEPVGTYPTLDDYSHAIERVKLSPDAVGAQTQTTSAPKRRTTAQAPPLPKDVRVAKPPNQCVSCSATGRYRQDTGKVQCLEHYQEAMAGRGT